MFNHTKFVDLGAELRWLERTPDKREVGGSSPLVPILRYGPLVKGLRHRLFTAVTRVRIPYGLYLSNLGYSFYFVSFSYML